MRTDVEEMLDRAQEQEYWRNYDKSKGNCLFVLLALVVVGTLPLWGLWL